MKIKVTLLHRDHGEAITELDVRFGADDIVSRYEDIVTQARKNVASRHVDYESFGNDSAYADRLDVVGDEFSIEDIEVISEAPRLRYHIYGHYSSDDGGTWSDHVYARCDDEADFQGRFQMACNEGQKPGNAHDFLLTMEESEIYDCYPEPITKDEAIGLVTKIAELQLPDQMDQLIELAGSARQMLKGELQHG